MDIDERVVGLQVWRGMGKAKFFQYSKSGGRRKRPKRVTDGFYTDDGGIRATEMASAPAVGIFPSEAPATTSKSW